ncbi:response regulator [Rhizorhabdus dicambivorans]|uniref:Response regulator n=1 Tax=Rhizorhabdus dicambivorans TaxID=1850238 RepID=A0A2A4FVX4_9SPHN|nr:response regulator [Rhizorhabdus dicambivorans]ATE64504.1 response regulator [Rhizorhabdus dicambivorans]PCE41598.1 response regulator [Rhizorhabdus dicambivorans]
MPREKPNETQDSPFLGRLLYVEDNAHIAEITCLLLEDSGLEITQAESAEHALRIVDESDVPFDIVLTDVVMPGLSGVQLARRLNRRWPDLPIVLVSGFSDELAMGYGGQYELLRKPFTRGALIDILQRHLDGSVYQTAC